MRLSRAAPHSRRSRGTNGPRDCFVPQGEASRFGAIDDGALAVRIPRQREACPRGMPARNSSPTSMIATIQQLPWARARRLPGSHPSVTKMDRQCG